MNNENLLICQNFVSGMVVLTAAVKYSDNSLMFNLSKENEWRRLSELHSQIENIYGDAVPKNIIDTVDWVTKNVNPISGNLMEKEEV